MQTLRRTRTASFVLAMLVFVSLMAACSSKAKPAGSSATASPAPEEQRASAADVATGLRKIDGIAKQIADRAEGGEGAAANLDAQIEPAWAKIEGTVKSNDESTYLTFEDNFASLKTAAANGDGPRAAKASDAVSAAVNDYLSRYPG